MMKITDEMVKHMVDRFLGWKLPEGFNPDGGISFKPFFNENSPFGPMKAEPIGTNLFDAQQAEEMVRYMLDGLAVEDARPQAVEGMEPVAAIVPDGCSGSAFAFEPGVLHVNNDGSGYIAVDEDDWILEDDRCEGPDGPEGSVHWISKIPASDMQELRNFLNGASRAVDLSDQLASERERAEKAEWERDEFRSALGTTSGRHFLADSRAKCAEAALAQSQAELARLRDLVAEKVRMAEGPAYLNREDAAIATLNMGKSWLERAREALKGPSHDA